MRTIFYFSIFLSLFLWGCKSKSRMTTPAIDLSDAAGSTNESHLFSSDVLYVIGKEYELINDITSEKYKSALAKGIISPETPVSLAEYMEMRLLELYPKKAFKGMISHFGMQEIERLMEKKSQVLEFDNNYREFSFLKTSENIQIDSFHPFISPEDEVQYMNMTDRETTKYRTLNELAASKKFADAADFNDLFKQDSIPNNLEPQDLTFFLQDNALLSMLLISQSAHLVFRVKLCKERAVFAAKRYYGDNISCGKKGDAFKHLYVSMMLRRYLSEDISYMVMDMFWENQGSNSPCDKHMDLHNNYVGRHTQYNLFRGDFWKDMYEWGAWSRNIHRFVENENNAVQKRWNKRQVEQFIQKDKETANKSKYIFWNEGVECEYPDP